MEVKAPSLSTTVEELSGGNQQKVVLGKWVLCDAKVLILDEPTRGIDVGAKYEIYKLMGDLAAEGKALVMVSSELPELIEMCDKIMICLANGDSQEAIAKKTGFRQSTISRELKKGEDQGSIILSWLKERQISTLNAEREN